MTTLSTYDAHERDVDERDADEEEAVADDHRCPDCGGSLTSDAARGETVCGDCGLVVEEDEIDHGPEWRAFDSAERDQKSRDHSERNLKQALGEIDRMGSALGVPESARETASVVYRRALDEGLLPGRSIEGIATASLYAAIRQANLPQTIDDMVLVSRVDEQEFTRAYRYINRELSLEIGPPDPADYLTKFTSQLDASDELVRRARDLLETGKAENVHSGKSPVGLAAASIYAAGLLVNEELTQETVSGATDVSTVTIRDRYRELLEAQSARDTGSATSGSNASA